jgi:curved DNA-binding protein CbpA
MDIQECFRFLEITNAENEDQLHLAYRRQVKCWHPDQFAHQPEIHARAEERLKQINQAYSILKDLIQNQRRPHAGDKANVHQASPRAEKKTSQKDFSAFKNLKRCFRARGSKADNRGKSDRNVHARSAKVGNTRSAKKPSFEQVFKKASSNPFGSQSIKRNNREPLTHPSLFKRRKKSMRVEGFVSPSPISPVRPVSKISRIEGSD